MNCFIGSHQFYFILLILYRLKYFRSKFLQTGLSKIETFDFNVAMLPSLLTPASSLGVARWSSAVRCVLWDLTDNVLCRNCANLKIRKSRQSAFEIKMLCKLQER